MSPAPANCVRPPQDDKRSHDLTRELQARRGHRSAEPKPFASSRACRPFDSLQAAYAAGRRAYRAGKPLGDDPHSTKPTGNRSFVEWGEWARGWIYESNRLSNLERIKSGPHRRQRYWAICEKCARPTHYLVEIAGGARWAAWCGCAP